MAKKPTKDEQIKALANALKGMLVLVEGESGGGSDLWEGNAHYEAACAALKMVGAIADEPVKLPLTPNRVAAIFCEMHKAQFGYNPRFDGADRQALTEIAKMFEAAEELQFRMIVREYLDDATDPWMNGSDTNPPMMFAVKWLNSSARIMRYESQITEKEHQDDAPVLPTAKRDPFEGIPT